MVIRAKGEDWMSTLAFTFTESDEYETRITLSLFLHAYLRS